MPESKETFLDSKTLIAIVLLFLSWLGWDYYMKKKYPDRLKKESRPAVVKTEEAPQPVLKKDSTAFSLPEKHLEKEFLFEGANMEILFSSRGFGIKKLKLKNYFNRNQEPVQFISEKTPLFSSLFLDYQKIPFEIKREANRFIGVFSSSSGQIKKTIDLEDEKFALKVQTEITPFKEGFMESILLSFSHPLSQKKPEGFLKMFFIYGLDFFKAFLLYQGKEKKRLLEKELPFCEKAQPDFCKALSQQAEPMASYKNTQLVALGGKYFGKAFINESSLLPSVQLVKGSEVASAFVKYDFLHSKKQKLAYSLFLGPKSLKNLESLGGSLRQWLDFGFFSWMARPLLLFLIQLYNFCHNWGLAIILLTVVIRLALLPINIKSYKSMKIMQKIQPQLKEIRETYKSDPKKMNKEVMALMKENKANPLGGCLPMFIQLPVFFALYRVLGESIELYQAPFLFWIKDLSLKDPYFIFPVLAGLVLFVQQIITPMNLPKEQARFIRIMPLIFSVFMLNLPSGLTLYIFISGLFGLVQQTFFVRLSPSQ